MSTRVVVLLTTALLAFTAVTAVAQQSRRPFSFFRLGPDDGCQLFWVPTVVTLRDQHHNIYPPGSATLFCGPVVVVFFEEPPED